MVESPRLSPNKLLSVPKVFLTLPPTPYPEQGDLFFRPDMAALRTDFFEKLVSYGYTQDQISLVERAYPLMYFHEVIGQKRKIDGSPYIHHPLEMAKIAAHMKLDPTLIIASMLHDVPEDAKYDSLNSSDAWLKTIEETYVDYADKDRLMRILRAEQKTETLDMLLDSEKEAVIQYYAKTPLGKRSLEYLATVRNGGTQISDKDQKEVATVLYDLNRLMSDSFITDSAGNKSFDPSLLTVKVLDTWQNLQTTGFWGTQLENVKKDAGTITKLIRARILTNIAEMFGMREVASSMTQNIAKLQNINDIHNPHILTSPVERLERSHKIDAKLHEAQALSESIRRAFGASDQKNVFLQMPWADPRTVEITDGLPTPVWYISSNRGFGDNDAQTTTPLADGYTLKGPVGLPDGALRTTLGNAFGRLFKEYFVEKDGVFYGKVKVGSAAPRIIHTLRSDAPAHNRKEMDVVPERHIFHPMVTKYTRDDQDQRVKPKLLEKIDTSMINLLEFIYSPREFLEWSQDHTQRAYLLIINGYFYLATNQTTTRTVYEIAREHGVSHPTVRPIGEGQTALPVREGDTGILNRMYAQGMLPYNAVIVEALQRSTPVYNEVTLRHTQLLGVDTDSWAESLSPR